MVITKTFPKVTNTSNNTTGVLSKMQMFNNVFLMKNDNTSFFASKDENISNISIKDLNSKKKKGFILELLCHGLNYSNKRLKMKRPAFNIDVHKSELFICHEAVVKTYKSRLHKRRLLFFSFDKKVLSQLEAIIKKLRLPNIYTGKGIYARTDLYITKKIKKK
jgi:hypothetical protein